VIKLLNKNSNHSAGTTRTKKTCCRDQKSKTVQIAIQESTEEIITNVTDITAGNKKNNKRQVFLVITDRWNGAKNCGGITSSHSDILFSNFIFIENKN